MKALRVNSHIHSPYSFSAFESLEQAVMLAREQGVAALGLSDFNTVDGHEEFAKLCARHGVYPLHNMETITLVRDDKEKGLRYNDNNPGIIYFCCEALDFPTSFSPATRDTLRSLWAGTQERIRAMIAKVNAHAGCREAGIQLDYETVRARYAKNTVRERHLCTAMYDAVLKRHGSDGAAQAFTTLLGSATVDIGDAVATQNSIRAALLKAGKPCYIEENSDAFLTPEQARELVLDGGGVPCYPVLINDTAGLTEYERNPDALADTLGAMGIHCIEFIPQRNTLDHFRSYVLRMHERGFNIIFGTEHNTPTMIPMTPLALGGAELGDDLREIAYRGVCVLAAHQEAHREGRDGFVDRKGQRLVAPSDMDEWVRCGDKAIRRAVGK